MHSDPPSDEERYERGLELLVTVVPALFSARDQGDVLRLTCRAARQLTDADGATVVLRDADQCFYAEEDAIEPLWKGRRFPLAACVSGWSMLNARPVMIEDIYGDARVPAEAYRPTFVKSLLIVPIRSAAPIGAIGSYWSRHRMPTVGEVKLLTGLANSAAVALDQVRRVDALESSNRHRVNALENAHRAEDELRRELAAARRIAAAAIESEPRGNESSAMAALRRLSGHFVHDFSEVLADIVVCGNLLADSLSAQDPLRMEAVTLLRASARGVRLIKELLPFSRRQTLRPRWTLIDTLVVGIRPTLERLLGTTIQLELSLSSEPQAAYVDSEQLEEVIVNLVVNAQEAMPSGGTLRIETHTVPLAHDHALARGLVAGDYVTVTVSDTGVGIPKALTDRIFEPFFSTKAVGESRRGLGLSSVYGIVKQSGGDLMVDSQLGRGTVISLLLPCHVAVPTADQP
ncbi:MAG: ATP-binding protein [Polyangiales bacterium]